jgi:hypothetical protein
MDLASVTRILDTFYERWPFLPRPSDLAATIVNAHGAAEPASTIVMMLWPVGGRAGAVRGHAITVGAIRGELAQALADPSPDERGQWLVAGMARAADEMPGVPDPSRRYTVPKAGALAGHAEDIEQALKLGLRDSWNAGHFDAAERAFGQFVDAVIDLVGLDRLVTTFLTPSLPAYALLDEIGFLAYRAAELDRENPLPKRAEQVKPEASRAFRTPRARHSSIRIAANQGRSTGPRRTGPGR